MEEFKAKKIIESLESIAAEEGADALTGEVIEECCKVNGVSPEDFRNFIRENIDLQKLKELQELEEISLEKLDQVAGGVQPAKRGLASFLAATSLLGSAANFTASADSTAPISARRDMRTAQTVNRPTSATKNGRGKKKQSDWKESDIRTAIGLGTFAVCAPIIAWWALSPQKNNNSSKSIADSETKLPQQHNPEGQPEPKRFCDEAPSPHQSESRFSTLPGRSATTPACGYNLYNYKPTYMGKSACEDNKLKLTRNVNSAIELLNLNAHTTRKKAATFFRTIDNDPRRGIVDYKPAANKSYPLPGLSAEHEYVYDVPSGYCKVHDYSSEQPIKVTTNTCTRPAATLWWVRRYSLPALFAVDAALRQETKGARGLDINHTAVQNAGNASSPGGDILKGSGTQEESLMMDTYAYPFLNSTYAYENYYKINRDSLQKIRQAKNSNYSACAVTDWDKTGIIDRALYTRDVPLANAHHGEKLNMITIAAGDYNSRHAGTYMGPIADNCPAPHALDYTKYDRQLIRYLNTLLRTAHAEHNTTVVITLGGCGAYKGVPKNLIATLRIVLTQYGSDANTCWASCFDHIVFAADNSDVAGLLYAPYQRVFGTESVRFIDQD